MNKIIKPCSLTEISKGLRNNTISLVDYINETCDYLDQYDESIKAFLPEAGRRKRLLAEANDLLAKYPDSIKRLPLFGILIGVKDLFIVDGFPTQVGSQLPASCFAGKEASSVTKLKEVGALILGKTVTTEFAYFSPGATANPHNHNHTPGGSSSGSAAAVAAGFCPLALGTQTIASVIRPATYCGIIGFKPSYGRIATDGVFPFSPSADHIGFFVQDLDSIGVVAKVLINDWKKALNQREKPLRVGIPAKEFLHQVEEKKLLSEFKLHCDSLEKKGMKIIDTDLFSDIEHINTIHKKLIACEFYQTHQGLFNQYSHLYSQHSADLYKIGSMVSEKELQECIVMQQEYRNKVSTLMEKMEIDIWLSPATTTTAPATLKQTGSPLMSLPWTFTGLPSITLPYNRGTGTMPAGLQIVGNFYEDEQLLKFSQSIAELI